ncbi:hypothetical protein VTJ49DRAFT_5839 [Mycothermus thermophilus]|uniref:Uncharacterized protein n=1 Tax=Humicola insolens TaxID=85995 RepID=A0ABR3VKG5_HUMIN
MSTPNPNPQGEWRSGIPQPRQNPSTTAAAGEETTQPKVVVTGPSDEGNNTGRGADPPARRSSTTAADIDLSFITPNPTAGVFLRPDMDKSDYKPFAKTGTVPAEGETLNDLRARDQIARAQGLLGRPLTDDEKKAILAHYRSSHPVRPQPLNLHLNPSSNPNPRRRPSATAADMDLSYIIPNPTAPFFSCPDMDDPSYSPFAATGTVPKEGETINDLRARDQMARTEAQLGRPLKDGEKATIIAYYKNLDQQRPTPDEVARNIPESVNNLAGTSSSLQQQQQQQQQEEKEKEEEQRTPPPPPNPINDLTLHPSRLAQARARAGDLARGGRTRGGAATVSSASTEDIGRGSGPAGQQQRGQGRQGQRQQQQQGRRRRFSSSSSNFERLVHGGQVMADSIAELFHRVRVLEEEVWELRNRGWGWGGPQLLGGWVAWLVVLVFGVILLWSFMEALFRSWVMGQGYEGWVNGGFNGLGTVMVFGGWTTLWSYTVSVVVLGYLGIEGFVSVTVRWGRRKSRGLDES